MTAPAFLESVERRGDSASGHGEPVSSRAQSDRFLAAFDAFAQAVRRARGAATQSNDGTLTLSQYALVQALSTREDARVRELADEAGIAASTATRILDALERRDIIRRTRAADDRRAVTVTLTDFGHDVLESQDEWLRGRQRAFYAGLPDIEQDLVPDLLLRLADLIDELAAGPES
ncbi:MAG: winged helix-turn-helix transcriptional regulator [Solirubrobacterales bacterium]|nr:winged helix-turn-helix transcriptional regulator [Solirubrobacterales bacterium]MBV9800463.1 winged helix-turn-helix transcriptional regulator [Solirubrobacterales bacterium]